MCFNDLWSLIQLWFLKSILLIDLFIRAPNRIILDFFLCPYLRWFFFHNYFTFCFFFHNYFIFCYPLNYFSCNYLILISRLQLLLQEHYLFFLLLPFKLFVQFPLCILDLVALLYTYIRLNLCWHCRLMLYWITVHSHVVVLVCCSGCFVIN